jgi:hypothetical protein
LTDYTRFVETTAIDEDMLFCKPINRTTTTKELFKIVNSFMEIA